MIQIKGVNDYLLFIFNDEVPEDQLLSHFSSMIASPAFSHQNYYPKAHFDFGKREVTKEFFYKLMSVLEKARSIVFCELETKKKLEKQLLHMKKTIRNGEILSFHEDVLFEGNINPGAMLVVYGNVYILGKVSGMIQLYGEDVSISLSNASNAILMINDGVLEEVNVNCLSVFKNHQGSIQKKQEVDVYG